jgi:hypothetical protein
MFYFVLVLALIALLASARSVASDFSLNQYTDAGEVAQITYAGRFLSKCPPIVGFTAARGKLGVLIRAKRKSHPLLAAPLTTIELSNGYAMCAVGLESDCSRVKRDWRDVVESDIFTYGEVPSLEKLSSRVSSFFTRGLYRESEDDITRPLAASVIVLQQPAFNGERDATAKLRVLHNTGAVVEGAFGVLGSLQGDDDSMHTVAALVESCIEIEDEDEDEDRDKDKDDKGDSRLRRAARDIMGALQTHLEGRGIGDTEMEFECAVCSADGTRCCIGDQEEALRAFGMND